MTDIPINLVFEDVLNLRDAIVPDRNSTAKIGKNYNGQLIHFVNQSWQVASAQTNLPSLKPAMNALRNFQPTWEN